MRVAGVLQCEWLVFCNAYGWCFAMRMAGVLQCVWLLFCNAYGWCFAMRMAGVLQYVWLVFCNACGWCFAMRVARSADHIAGNGGQCVGKQGNTSTDMGSPDPRINGV